MPRRALPTFVSLILALMALLAPAAAQADKTFGSRYATTARGDLTVIGNTLMTCPGTGAPCPDAQSGAVVADDNDFVMGRVDVDGDGTTFDSSAAGVLGGRVRGGGAAGTGGGVGPPTRH